MVDENSQVTWDDDSSGRVDIAYYRIDLLLVPRIWVPSCRMGGKAFWTWGVKKSSVQFNNLQGFTLEFFQKRMWKRSQRFLWEFHTEIFYQSMNTNFIYLIPKNGIHQGKRVAATRS